MMTYDRAIIKLYPAAVRTINSVLYGDQGLGVAIHSMTQSSVS